jgi:drug/metabolite transporter (DMT)-like permease
MARHGSRRYLAFMDNAGTATRRGYLFALLSMAISGVAIFVNSQAVKGFPDSTLYTALKNAVAGLVLLVPLAVSRRRRAELGALTPRERLLLVVVAVIGGSAPYALYFRGLELSTPVTASLIDHTQFLLVAVAALLFLGERLGTGVWVSLAVLFLGLSVGAAADALRVDAGVPFLAAGTLLFAADFVLMKYLLRGVPAFTIMVFKLSLGSALLLALVAATGRLGLAGGLSAVQWAYVGATGLVLLSFTAASVAGLRHASATAVTAIPAGAPLVTTLLVVAARGGVLSPVRLVGLLLVLLAVVGVLILGRRREMKAGSA